MNNPKYRQQWILDCLKANTTTTYTYVYAKYAQKFAKSKKTFDSDWLKANTIFSTYQETINKAKLEESIKIEKQAVKKAILSKHDALEILTTIAKGTPKKINGTVIIPSASEQRGAIDLMAKFEGWHTPTQIEQKVDLQQITTFLLPENDR